MLYPVIGSLECSLFWHFYISLASHMVISISVSVALSLIFTGCCFIGPINREMRHLISSLQNHNHQLKGDVQRYKRKLRETQTEINKVGFIHPLFFSKEI